MAKEPRSGGALIKTIEPQWVVAAAEAYLAAEDKAAFRRQYGRGSRSDYDLLYKGERVPSKTVVSAAYHLMTGEKAHGFSGGMSGAAAALVNLGFEIDDATPRNPDWSEDELILALELYKSAGLANQRHPAVIALSDLLQGLGIVQYGEVGRSYRNPNGVKLKLANFRALDPTFIAQGRVGMRRGNRLEAVIWSRYADDPAGLRKAAERIRDHLAALEREPDEEGEDPAVEEEAEEGGVTYRLHRKVERSARLRGKKIAAAMKADPLLRCEACTFSFVQAFGASGKGFAEVHHTDPFLLGKGIRKTALRDLSILCANCHRMAHRGGKARSIAELQDMLSATAGSKLRP